MKIAELCSKIEQQLAARSGPEERMQLAVQALCQIFRVGPNEVAFFAFSPETKALSFRWPLKLQKSGFVPLNSADALIARTVRENRGFVNNHFASARHSSVFEHVRLDPASQEPPRPIQKILSVPLPVDERVTGVVQICRKGEEPASAGDDFSKTELVALTELGKVLARYL